MGRNAEHAAAVDAAHGVQGRPVPTAPGEPQGTLTGNSVADLDEDFLEVGEVAPGRLEHVHEAVDEQVLHPAQGRQVTGGSARGLRPPPSAPPPPPLSEPLGTAWAAGTCVRAAPGGS